MIWRRMIEHLNPGHRVDALDQPVRVRLELVPWSSSSSPSPPAPTGVNIDTTWVPSGASVLSTTVGIAVSLNGTRRRLAEPRVLERLLQLVDVVEQLDRAAVDLGVESGSAVNSGSSARARLIFTVPLRVFQCSMSWTNASGSSWRSMCCRNLIFG